MKKLIILAAIIPTLIFGQSQDELGFLKELNKYRDSFGLSPVSIDLGLNKAAELHVNYALEMDKIGQIDKLDHEENPIGSLNTIKYWDARIRNISGLTPIESGEIITFGQSNVKVSDLNKNIEKLIAEKFFNNLPKKCIRNYKLSKGKDGNGGHNAVLKSSGFDNIKVGISIKTVNVIENGVLKLRYVCVIVFGR